MKFLGFKVFTFIFSFIALASNNIGGKIGQAIQQIENIPQDVNPSELALIIDSILSFVGAVLASLIWRLLRKKFPDFFRIKNRTR